MARWPTFGTASELAIALDVLQGGNKGRVSAEKLVQVPAWEQVSRPAPLIRNAIGDFHAFDHIGFMSKVKATPALP